MRRALTEFFILAGMVVVLTYLSLLGVVLFA
jgi:hypothetical protein